MCWKSFNLLTHTAVTIFNVSVGEKEEWIGRNLKYWNCVSAMHSGTFFSRKRTVFAHYRYSPT
jgi:hypothetical protein